ncbi:lytic transglycosylase domain-containing protein [Ferruginibacter lapsinanis]|uniref:lytic transglycosylase domain-containing protein n=1 Tax=Ferruginibacter lapsinanis TaxID=563172 RepID=UPI001E374C63|nr:lytic transglycosylase domain-containing protein [Ferruginibacter lapsinanis]UEG50377.1 lytic transglycosylase domain-containing protein [Ferruginibacter lapsinanis]
MNRFLSIAVVSLLMFFTSAGKTWALPDNKNLHHAVRDTMVEDIATEDATIDEIIQARENQKVKKEKIAYISQVTQYGFKNLFSPTGYNTALPYSTQINPNAISFTQDYMRVHGNYLQKMKGWGQPYFNLIENILQQYGLPKELKYIAVIESNLSTDATSPVGAGGPWQFMPYTAKNFGLTVNSFVDDRRDYYKSTHAASKYLLSLYKEMHDWLLVMAAYNGGPGRVYNAIKKSGSRDFWQLQYYLPEESRTYVKRFIATQYIMEGSNNIDGSGDIAAFDEAMSRTTYGLSPTKNPYNTKPKLSAQQLVDVEVLPISGKYNSLVIAKNLSMDITTFNNYNPGFDQAMSTIGNFDLRLPPEKMQLFTANKYQILNECVQVLYNSTSIPSPTKTVYKRSAKKRA